MSLTQGIQTTLELVDFTPHVTDVPLYVVLGNVTITKQTIEYVTGLSR